MTRLLKYLLLPALSVLSGIALPAQNPISPEGVYIADPSARVLDGVLVVAGSVDRTSGRYCSKTHHLLTSVDAVHWSLMRNVYASDQTLYAPDIIKWGGRYHLYTDHPDGSEWVAAASRPGGPYGVPVRLDGVKGIDPCVFVDDDGQAYYFWGQFSAKGARLDPDGFSIDPSSVREGLVTEDGHHFHEGSFVFKHDGWYYFVFADISRQGAPTCLGYAMSRNVMGPYEYKGVIIDNAGCDPRVWNNHGSVVEYNGKWYVLYHRSTHNGKTMRKACIEPITFRPDGTIPEVEMTSQGAGAPLDGFKPVEAARACLFHGGPYIFQEGECEYVRVPSGNSRACWKYLDFSRPATKVFLRVRSQGGGSIRLMLKNSFSSSVGRIDIPAQKDWTEIRADVKIPAGTHALWMSFYGKEGEVLFDLDEVRFE